MNMQSAQRKPNFIIGGTSAGGTSFLTAMLVQHPEVYLPKDMRPEPHYFYKSWEYSKGDEYYLNRWFKEVPAYALAVGERSSSYLFGALDCAKKMYAFNPDLKLIFTLRNPIERTWANYRYTVLQGLEELSFEDALKNEAERVEAQQGIWAEIQPHNYTGRGFYGSQLAAFREVFPASQILVIKSELLSSQTAIEMQKVESFLGLSQKNFPYVRAVDHTSPNVINPKVQVECRQYFTERFDKIIEAIRKNESPTEWLHSEEDFSYFKLIKSNVTNAKQNMSDYSRAYLNELFCFDLELLSKYIDFDISDWSAR